MMTGPSVGEGFAKIVTRDFQPTKGMKITVMIIKKDNTREAFDPRKVISGIVKSCQKRPVSMDQIEEVAKNIETKVNHTGKKEVTSTYIGELVMDELKDLDSVAYVRFASVYREFKDLESFYEEIINLKDDKGANS